MKLIFAHIAQPWFWNHRTLHTQTNVSSIKNNFVFKSILLVMYTVYLCTVYTPGFLLLFMSFHLFIFISLCKIIRVNGDELKSRLSKKVNTTYIALSLLYWYILCSPQSPLLFHNKFQPSNPTPKPLLPPTRPLLAILVFLLLQFTVVADAHEIIRTVITNIFSL